jgi:hypothetical protein
MPDEGVGMPGHGFLIIRYPPLPWFYRVSVLVHNGRVNPKDWQPVCFVSMLTFLCLQPANSIYSVNRNGSDIPHQ